MSKVSSQLVQMDNVLFRWSPNASPVLNIQAFSIERGERVFMQGPSGSGKTTLLSLIAAVLSPQSGSISIDGESLESLRGGQRDQFRVDRIGLVFQQFNLLPFLSVSENIQLSCRFSAARRARASESGRTLDEETNRLLEAMHLSPAEMRNRSTSDLSVGQQQRVAVARALIGSPPLIIADEPTSSLDSDSRKAFLELLFNEIKTSKATLLFVSHDAGLADLFDRRVDLRQINSITSATDELSSGLK